MAPRQRLPELQLLEAAAVAAALECATLTSVAQADLAAAAVHAVLLLAVPEIPRQLLPAKVITAVQALLTVAAVVVGRML
jgi:hypothetical protein